jgi:hypothetical protein
MERYVWAGVVVFVATLAAATALILGGRSAELERFAILAAQGIGLIINFVLVYRANRNTENRIRKDINGGIHESIENGLKKAAEDSH